MVGASGGNERWTALHWGNLRKSIRGDWFLRKWIYARVVQRHARAGPVPGEKKSLDGFVRHRTEEVAGWHVALYYGKCRLPLLPASRSFFESGGRLDGRSENRRGKNCAS